MSKLRWDRIAVVERISRRGSEPSDAGPPLSYTTSVTGEEKPPRGSNVCRACRLWYPNLEQHFGQSIECYLRYLESFVAEATLRWSRFECHGCGSALTAASAAIEHLSACGRFRALLAKSVNVEPEGSRLVRDVVSDGFAILQKLRATGRSKNQRHPRLRRRR